MLVFLCIQWYLGRSEFSQNEARQPDQTDPLIPVGEKGVPPDWIDGHASRDDLEGHEEVMGGEIAAELDDGRLVVLVVQGQGKDQPERGKERETGHEEQNLEQKEENSCSLSMAS